MSRVIRVLKFLYCSRFAELNDESGKPIWRNRVDSWKEKKEKKALAKKGAAKAQAPPVEEQIMDEKE